MEELARQGQLSTQKGWAGEGAGAPFGRRPCCWPPLFRTLEHDCDALAVDCAQVAVLHHRHLMKIRGKVHAQSNCSSGQVGEGECRDREDETGEAPAPAPAPRSGAPPPPPPPPNPNPQPQNAECTHQVGLGGLLYGQDRRGMPPVFVAKVVCDLADEALEGSLLDEELRRVLVLADLPAEGISRATRMVRQQASQGETQKNGAYSRIFVFHQKSCMCNGRPRSLQLPELFLADT